MKRNVSFKIKNTPNTPNTPGLGGVALLVMCVLRTGLGPWVSWAAQLPCGPPLKQGVMRC